MPPLPPLSSHAGKQIKGQTHVWVHIFLFLLWFRLPLLSSRRPDVSDAFLCSSTSSHVCRRRGCLSCFACLSILCIPHSRPPACVRVTMTCNLLCFARLDSLSSLFFRGTVGLFEGKERRQQSWQESVVSLSLRRTQTSEQTVSGRRKTGETATPAHTQTQTCTDGGVQCRCIRSPE